MYLVCMKAHGLKGKILLILVINIYYLFFSVIRQGKRIPET